LSEIGELPAGGIKTGIGLAVGWTALKARFGGL
jgi:hypothetical protein